MSHPSDWYRAAAGHYWRGLREQIMYRTASMAHLIGALQAGWYYRRLKPSGQMARGPYATLRAAVKAAPKKRA